MTVISFVFGLLLLGGLLFFAAVVMYELVCRLRDRAFTPEQQLQRAGLGNYPTWRK